MSRTPIFYTAPSAVAREALRDALEHLYSTYPYQDRLPLDPVSLVHQDQDAADAEIVGLLASSLAYGRASVFLPKLWEIHRHMAARGGPRAFIETYDRAHEMHWLGNWRYRMTAATTLDKLFVGTRGVILRYGSLGQAFSEGFSPEHRDIGPALETFVDQLERHSCGSGPSDFSHLLPRPSRGSACKRLNLYLRWMIRPRDRVDLGLWSQIPPSHLLLPLDTHVMRISYNLGLTDRTDASWRTAREISDCLKAIEPGDPIKFDFALCHIGMAGDCPRVRHPLICMRCELRGICRWWTGEADPEFRENERAR